MFTRGAESRRRASKSFFAPEVDPDQTPLKACDSSLLPRITNSHGQLSKRTTAVQPWRANRTLHAPKRKLTVARESDRGRWGIYSQSVPPSRCQRWKRSFAGSQVVGSFRKCYCCCYERKPYRFSARWRWNPPRGQAGSGGMSRPKARSRWRFRPRQRATFQISCHFPLARTHFNPVRASVEPVV